MQQCYGSATLGRLKNWIYEIIDCARELSEETRLVQGYFFHLKNNGVAVGDDDQGHEDGHDEVHRGESQARAPAHGAGMASRVVVETGKELRSRKKGSQKINRRF